MVDPVEIAVHGFIGLCAGAGAFLGQQVTMGRFRRVVRKVNEEEREVAQRERAAELRPVLERLGALERLMGWEKRERDLDPGVLR